MTEAEELELLEMELQVSKPKKDTSVQAYHERNAAIEPEYNVGEAPAMAQVGRGIMDVYQGTKQLGKNIVGDGEEYNKELKDEIALYDKNNPGFQPARIAGNLATPLTLVPGMAGKGLVAKGLYTLGAGGMFGATQPVTDDEYWKSKGAQTAIGAAVAPVAPLAISGAKLAGRSGRHLLRPFSEKGITKDLKEMFIQEAGDKNSINKIREALVNRKEYVPGNKPTVGMAIADAARGSGDDYGAALVRLEKELASEGIEGQSLRAQAAAQAARRSGVIDNIAGTGDDLARAEAARASRTAPLYKAVEQSKATVNTAPVIGLVDDLLAKNPNETSITTPLAAIRAKIVDGDKSPQAMYSLSKELKAMMGRITPGGQKEFSVGALDEIKKVLDKQIGESERAFKVAQAAYKAKSAPINRMQVGRELQKALVGSTDEALEQPGKAPTQYLNAVREAPKLLKRSTGFPRYNELGDVLKPEQVSGVKNVAEEMLRGQQQGKMASSVKPILSNLDTGIEPRLPRILERNVVIANYALRKLGVDKSPEYHRVAIDILQNPDKMLKLLGDPNESMAKKIARKIYQMTSDRASTAALAAPAQTTSRGIGGE